MASPSNVSAHPSEENRKITVKRRGNAMGFFFFESFLRLFGLRGAYFLLEFVCLHYLLFDRAAVNSALAYTTKRFPHDGNLKQLRHVHRLFVNQGRQLIDRRAIVRRPDMFRYQQISDNGGLEVLQESSQGVVLLTSHAGNWQVALRQMGHLKKPVSVVARPEDNAAVREALKMGVEAKPVQAINPEGYLGGVLEMLEALKKGHIVCIMGDRNYGFDCVEVPFLGHTAYFPYGAFLVASAAGCPVVPLLTYKISDRDYIAHLPHVWKPECGQGKDRKIRLQEWVARYAGLLEEFVEKHPYECFLFHNVWNQDKGEKDGIK